jgi:hypothetical protein
MAQPVGGGIKHVDLEKFKLILLRVLSEQWIGKVANLPAVEISTLERWAHDEITLRIVLPLLGERLETISVHYPRDWWQAIKERFAPSWCKAIWPIQYDITEIDVLALYPKISLPKEEHALVSRTLRYGTAKIDKRPQGDIYPVAKLECRD